jgi:hypothetical protein
MQNAIQCICTPFYLSPFLSYLPNSGIQVGVSVRNGPPLLHQVNSVLPTAGVVICDREPELGHWHFRFMTRTLNGENNQIFPYFSIWILHWPFCTVGEFQEWDIMLVEGR